MGYGLMGNGYRLCVMHYGLWFRARIRVRDRVKVWV
jgi:hypothetical protein